MICSDILGIPGSVLSHQSQMKWCAILLQSNSAFPDHTEDPKKEEGGII